MKRPVINRRYALSVGAKLQKQLLAKSIPLRTVFVFGSVATGKTHEWSDIDLAVVCDPFLASKFDEQNTMSRTARSIDVRAEVVCLHPGDFKNKYFTLAQEVRRHGITVARHTTASTGEGSA